MTSQFSGRRRHLSNAIHMVISTADALRRFWLIALICLVTFAGAAVWLTTSTKASQWVWKGWERVFGSPAAGNAGLSALAQPQTSGTTGYMITVIDEPIAGTSAVEGTIVFAVNASGAMTGSYSDQTDVGHGFVCAAGGTSCTSFDAPNAGSSPPAGWFQGTVGIAIDTAGDVVGIYIDSNNAYHGFLREAASPNTITVLDDPNAPTATSSRGTFPTSINDNGQIVGNYTTGRYDTASLYHGFLYSIANGTYTEIDEPNAGTGSASSYQKEGTIPAAINASGVVTGYYADSSGNRHGFIRSAAGNYTSFDGPGATTNTGKGGGLSGTLPMSIDAAGDVVGSYTDSSGVRHGFILPAGSTTATSFDAPGANTTSQKGTIGGTLAASIDPTGSYISGGYTDPSGLDHGFVDYLPLTSVASFTTFSAPNAATSLTAFNFTGTGSFGVNASGTAVGFYVDSNEVLHGFQYAPTATPTPTFNLAQGTYTSAQSVDISDTDSAATIYYTTDGSKPTVNSTKYTEQISVSSTETINAIALDSTSGGYIESAEASATYTISIPSNPAPVIGGLSPAFTSAGGTAFTLTVSGSGFVSNSTVYWGSTALTTTYGSATTLTAQVPAADIASAGITSITVETPTPGGGTSNSLQFEVDSGTSGSGPTFTTLTATVAPGSTASYSVTLPSGATDVSVTCLNLPTGASCSYSSSAGAVTITTSATTPAGTYQITVVFTETLPGAATGFVLFPFLLLPLLLIRKRLAARGIWLTACLVFALTAGVACAVGCGGGGSGSIQTHQVTSSGVVTLKVQ
jgi:hypothetical protein